jgi:RNA polymerase sigma factor (sigma-70 family)
MAQSDLGSFVQNLCRRLAEHGGLPDADLLGRWLAERDQAAFELLVRRHGPVVLGVCRRLLDHPADVEDAFQATFLLLVRKAGAIRKGDSLGSWLYKTAFRVALRARAARGRKEKAGVLALGEVPSRQDEDLEWRDLRPVLDEEVNALPEKYRVPFVLCHVEGRTNQEAADALGCPLGTVLSRLAWARQRLRSRLTRRGLAVTTTGLAAALAQSAEAAVPAQLLRSTLGAVMQPAGASAPVLLMKGVLRTMFWNKVKMTATALTVGCLLLMGTASVAYRAGAAPVPSPRLLAGTPAVPSSQREAKAVAPAPIPNSPDTVVVPARQDGILQLIGREIRTGEKVRAADRVTVTVDGVVKTYRRLRRGDRVEKGELLARVDDLLARKEVQLKEAKLAAARAAIRAAAKTSDEAKKRYEAMLEIKKRAPGSIAAEELRGALLTFERYVEEVKSKEAEAVAAQRELEIARVLLDQHEIRSPVSGVILRILHRPGEAVRRFDPVFHIRPDKEE